MERKRGRCDKLLFHGPLGAWEGRVPRAVALATLQTSRGTSRHLEESTTWPEVVPREAPAPGVTGNGTLMLITWPELALHGLSMQQLEKNIFLFV